VIHPLLLHNDRVRRADERIFTPGQVGLMNGWGVFSTIKVIDGVLFAFSRHYARMKRDAALMRVPFPWAADELEERLLKLVDANEDYNSTLRVAAIRNKGTIFEGPGIENEVELVAFTTARNHWGEAVRLGVVRQARHSANMFAGTKITAWSMNLCWYEEAHERGLDEVVLLNERDEVSECTSANIFAAFGPEVFTPPLDSGCLPGVTRQVLLEAIRIAEFRVTEKVLQLQDLEKADGLFITSSTRDLLPVAEIEELRVRQGTAARDALQTAFDHYAEEYVRNAVRFAAGRGKINTRA
jgi:branched-chain amino acid aminotransferase